MQAKGFFSALFDYSFTSFVTPRIIKVLYVLATIVISLWTLLLILAGFNISSSAGAGMLLIGGPLFFLVSMIYARVFLELVIVFFRINGNVQEIRDERIGGAVQPSPSPGTAAAGTSVLAPAKSTAETEEEPVVIVTAVEPTAEVPPAASSSVPDPTSAPTTMRFCENCGAERRQGAGFCTSCGHA